MAGELVHARGFIDVIRSHEYKRVSLLNLALSFYLGGAIWAIEVDIFRSWKLVNATDFPKVQLAHWHKLPYWVFTPLALALAGSVTLIWYHPAGSPGMGDLGEFSLPTQFAHVDGDLLGPMAVEAGQRPSRPCKPVLGSDIRDALVANRSYQRLRCVSTCVDDKSDLKLKRFDWQSSENFDLLRILTHWCSGGPVITQLCRAQGRCFPASVLDSSSSPFAYTDSVFEGW